MKPITNGSTNRPALFLTAGLFAGVLAGILGGWFLFRKEDGSGHGKNQLAEGASSAIAEEAAIYTCSMHPQIRQNEPGKCPICGMELIPLKSASSRGEKPSSPFVHAMTPEAVALANIQTVRVDSSEMGHELKLSGRIAVNEKNRAVITANFSGRVEKLFIDFTGQQVMRGQKLASIYSPELITAQKELLEAARNKDANPALYRAVRERLKLWKISDGQVAAIEAAGEITSQLDIHADVSGVVTNRIVSTGDFVSKGGALFEIADLSAVWILLDAYAGDLPRIRVGDEVAFTVPSLPGREFATTVRFVDPVVNPQTRTASVRAEIANPGLVLKPEMFVNAALNASGSAAAHAAKGHAVTDPHKSLRIPKSAVLWTGERSVVYVEAPADGMPAFEMREIVLGSRVGDYYEVASGLRSGEKVVVNGVFSVDAAAQLSGNYSMMNRPGIRASQVPDGFLGPWSDFIEIYLAFKNALVASHLDSAQLAMKNLGPALRKLDAGVLQGELAAAWKKHAKRLGHEVEAMAAAKNLEAMRMQFKPLSDALIPAVEYFGVEGRAIYLNYCPMAASSEGAYWLSENEVVRNPYYGESMLNCGEIKKQLSSTTPRVPIEHRH